MFMFQKILALNLIPRLENVCLLATISDGKVGVAWTPKRNIWLFHVTLFLMKFHHIMLLQNQERMIYCWSHSLPVAYLEIKGAIVWNQQCHHNNINLEIEDLRGKDDSLGILMIMSFMPTISMSFPAFNWE